jgi:hypothetical protein
MASPSGRSHAPCLRRACKASAVSGAVIRADKDGIGSRCVSAAQTIQQPVTPGQSSATPLAEPISGTQISAAMPMLQRRADVQARRWTSHYGLPEAGAAAFAGGGLFCFTCFFSTVTWQSFVFGSGQL